MQRAAGAVRLSAHGNALRDLAHAGCLRACFPRRHGGALEAVIVNIAGGIADGDQLRVDIDTGAGTDMVIATPAAERVYRARQGAPAARISVALRIKDGARLAYLPQETILFDAAALDRTLDIEMHARGRYVGVEALVFGRQESAETLATLRLRDTVRLRRDGRLVFQDGIRLQRSVGALLASQPGAGGARGLATVIYAAPDAPALLDRLRGALAGAEAGASAWDGILVARILAPNALALRSCVVRALSVLHPAPLPRVWNR